MIVGRPRFGLLRTTAAGQKRRRVGDDDAAMSRLRLSRDKTLES